MWVFFVVVSIRSVSGGRLTDPVEFEVGFVDAGGGEVRRRMVDVADVPFEMVPVACSFPLCRGQRNYPGLYWAALHDAHVGFESWLERDEAMALDFDASVVASPRGRSGCGGRKRGGRGHMRRTSSPVVVTEPGWWSTAVR